MEQAVGVAVDLGDDLVQVHAVGVAWHRQLLTVIRELDASEAWRVDGEPTLERRFLGWRWSVVEAWDPDGDRSRRPTFPEAARVVERLTEVLPRSA